LKAIYSRSLKSAQTLGQDLSGIELYSEDSGDEKNYAALLKKGGIDAVIIALPITAQPTYIKQALTSGKHVLSEKPIAKDTKTADDLIKWHAGSGSSATWCVAENFRYLDSFLYGAERVNLLGKVLGFRTRVHQMVDAGGKYYETAWRKTPEYQGGFLLDGGVHFIGGTRLLLGEKNKPTRISAFSNQLQEHLPPVDTVDATWRTESGISGLFSLSFGTSFRGSEYSVACEKGTVSISRGVVVVTVNGKEEKKEFADEGSGVMQEVAAWGKGLEKGSMDPQQSPQEALQDLRVLEAMLRSGEQNGAPMNVQL